MIMYDSSGRIKMIGDTGAQGFQGAQGTTGSQGAQGYQQKDTGCRVRHTALQAITTGVWTAVTYNLEDVDDDSMHDNSTNNTRITINTAGKYYFYACEGWAAVATGVREMTIQRFGSVNRVIAHCTFNTAGTVNSTQTWANTIDDFEVGDYCEVYVRHNRGSDMNIGVTAGSECEFGCARLS